MKFKTTYIINILFLIVLILIVFRNTYSGTIFTSNNSKESKINSYFIKEDPDSIFENSLKANQSYRAIKSQLDSIEYKKFEVLHSNEIGTSSRSLFGVKLTSECDTCDINTRSSFSESGFARPKKYYLELMNYQEIEDSLYLYHKPIYFKNKGKFHKKYLAIDNSPSLQGPHLFWKTDFKTYGVEAELSDNKLKLKTILIPISKTQYSILNIAVWSITIIGLIVYLTCIFPCGFGFLYQVCIGNPFSEKNYFRLKFIAYALIAMTTFSLLIILILDSIYKSHFTKDFQLHIDWDPYLNYFAAGIFVYLLSIVVNHGNKLKDLKE
jgi:hypothetical protein